MRAASLLLLILMTVLGRAQEQTSSDSNTGTVKGTVVDSVTHQPVRKANVSLMGMGAGPGANAGGYTNYGAGGAPQPQGPMAQTTGPAGTFEMDNVPPGQYLLRVQQQDYPQARFGGVQRNITVKGGEQGTPQVVELVPGATVTGRVLDEDGDPLSGCLVRLLSAKPPYQETTTMGGSRVRSPSDSGEYRLSGVAAGKYLVAAQCQGSVFEPRPLSAGPDPLPSLAYPPQFYPAAGSAELAEVIDLAPGAEKSGVDFQMKPAHVTHIHVVLAGGADWRGRKDLQWQLIPAEPGALRIFGWRPIETANGEFEVTRVLPGSYHLVVTSGFSPAGNGAADGMIGATQQINAGDKPMEAVVALRPAVDLSGTLEIVGPAGANRLTPDQISVQLSSEYPSFFRSAPEPVKSDGSFTIKSAFPGPARVHINAPGAFLKSAWIGGAELTGGLVDLSSGARGELRITVSTNTASIHGTAPPMAQVMVTLVDQAGFGGMSGGQADQNGQFKIDDLAPGKYRVGLQVQMDFLINGAGSGQEVTLEEGQTLTIELREPNAAQ